MLVLQFVSGKAISFFFDDDRDHVIIINHVIHDCLWVVHAHTSDYNSDSIHTLRFPIPRHAKRTARTSGLGSSSSNAPVTVTSRWSIDGWTSKRRTVSCRHHHHEEKLNRVRITLANFDRNLIVCTYPYPRDDPVQGSIGL